MLGLFFFFVSFLHSFVFLEFSNTFQVVLELPKDNLIVCRQTKILDVYYCAFCSKSYILSGDFFFSK